MASAPDSPRPPDRSAAAGAAPIPRPAIQNDNFKSRAAVARFVLTTIILLAADQLVKHLTFSRLATMLVVERDGRVLVRSRTVELIPGFIHLEVTANQGAVFGLGQGQRWFFVGVSVAAVAFITFLFRRGLKPAWHQIVMGMLLAGVLGNMIDRVWLGYVRDMIHALPGWQLPYWLIGILPDWNWKYGDVFPWIFNVADSLLCVGVGILVVHGLLFAPPASKEEAASPAAARQAPAGPDAIPPSSSTAA